LTLEMKSCSFAMTLPIHDASRMLVILNLEIK